MKFRRFLSGLLFGLGCALIFIGILATVLPSVPNQQLQLVLGSFSLSSNNAIVQLINRAMSFALSQNWRVLLLGILATAAGALLLLHFTPKKQKPQSIRTEASIPASSAIASMPEAEAVPEVPNPFAVGTYLNHLPIRESKTDSSFVRYTTPILEPNRVENAPVSAETVPTYDFQLDESAPEATAPFFSNRLEAESKAIEAERSIPSQSGSSMLIRSAFDDSRANKAADVPKPEATRSAEAVPVRTTAPLAANSAMPPFSPRIRSTMGRKSSR